MLELDNRSGIRNMKMVRGYVKGRAKPLWGFPTRYCFKRNIASSGGVGGRAATEPTRQERPSPQAERSCVRELMIMVLFLHDACGSIRVRQGSKSHLHRSKKQAVPISDDLYRERKNRRSVTVGDSVVDDSEVISVSYCLKTLVLL